MDVRAVEGNYGVGELECQMRPRDNWKAGRVNGGRWSPGGMLKVGIL